MDISVYEMFLAVADSQSITKAAEKLHMTQPAAWMKMTSLEKKLDFPLFIREGKRMVLTPSGKVLYDYATRIVHLHREGLRSASKEAASQTQFLRIGSSVTIASNLLPLTVKKLKGIFPNGQYFLKSGHSYQIEQMINDHIIDFAFLRYSISIPGWTTQELTRDPVILIAPIHSDLAKKKDVTLEDISHYPIIVYDPDSEIWEKTSSFFKERDLPIKSFIQTDSSESVKKMVEEGLGISFLTWSVVKEDILDKKIAAISVEQKPYLFERPLYLVKQNIDKRTISIEFVKLIFEELKNWRHQCLEVFN